jgi:alpha-L-fucosidase 2
MRAAAIALGFYTAFASAPSRAAAAAATATVDWPAFLARHDLVWKKVPRAWEEGAFLGNGFVGAMMHATGESALGWELGRTDVGDRRPDAEGLRARNRLPIGSLHLETAGALKSADLRLDLWNAEVAGRITTARGGLTVRSYVHATLPVLVIELEPDGEESGARFVFRPTLAILERLLIRKTPLTERDLEAPPSFEERGPVRLSVQRRGDGGEHAVAWQERALGGGKRQLVLAITDSHPGPAARADAVAAVRRAVAQGPERLRRAHRAWWNAYYPQSFVSLPDTRLESFYWIQMYKLASATRADAPVIDTLGPWYHRTPWPRIWWNLNAQLSYWPVYASNRLGLGESLLGFIDRNKDRLRANVPEKWRAGSMAINRSSGLDGLSPVGLGKGPEEMSNLVWAMHNYWLHWRHTMDPAMARERLYPHLQASVNYLLQRLEPGSDGKLHLPEAISPEYPKNARDTNYDLSLLRWGCETLLALAARLEIADAPVAKWRDTLARLTPYPVGPQGYMIGRDQPLAESHRHFSHLLMIYPLRMVTGQNAQERALIERSLAHWIGFEGALQGYSFVGASVISSLLGKGDDAGRYLNDLVRRFVKPNTMYLESGPVIETPLSAAQAVHEMLLQSWGDTIRIFPAVPGAWKDVAFHDFRAEGAFMVSAVRAGGQTRLVRLKSLAGEPATLKVPEAAGGEPLAVVGRGGALEKTGDGTWKVKLQRGETVELVARTGARPAVAPVAVEGGKTNSFGLP